MDFSYRRDTYLARFARNGGLDPGSGTGGVLILRLWPITKRSMEIVSTVTDGGHGRLILIGSAGYVEETARLTRMIALWRVSHDMPTPLWHAADRPRRWTPVGPTDGP